MQVKSAVSVPKAGERVQFAALPVRVAASGGVEVLLVTSRETKRWIIPKGWPMKGRKPWEAAAQEAMEEAGVLGRPGKTPVGSYLYFKRQAAHFELCRAEVYLLLFTEQLESWPEKGQREAKWFDLEEAAMLVEEPGLISILQNFDANALGEAPRKRANSKSR